MRVRFRRPWLGAAVSLPILLIVISLAGVERSSVPHENCNCGTGQLCTDYKGIYGLAALAITIVLIIALLVINRDHSSYRP